MEKKSVPVIHPNYLVVYQVRLLMIILWVNVILLLRASKVTPIHDWSDTECNDIYCDWTCDWMSRLIMLNHILNYVSTQLVSSLIWHNWFQTFDSIESDSVFWLDLIKSGSIYFNSLWCYSSYLSCVIWQKTVPSIFRIIGLVRSRPHVKYTRMVISLYSRQFYLLIPGCPHHR